MKTWASTRSEELETAAHDGRLENYAGIGAKRLSGIRDSLAQRLRRVHKEVATTKPVNEPAVSELLDVVVRPQHDGQSPTERCRGRCDPLPGRSGIEARGETRLPVFRVSATRDGRAPPLPRTDRASAGWLLLGDMPGQFSIAPWGRCSSRWRIAGSNPVPSPRTCAVAARVPPAAPATFPPPRCTSRLRPGWLRRRCRSASARARAIVRLLTTSSVNARTKSMPTATVSAATAGLHRITGFDNAYGVPTVCAEIDFNCPTLITSYV